MSDMTLRHYAAAPVTFEDDLTYEQREPSRYGKPHGFWVSVQGEDDWPSWCTNEGLEHWVPFEHAVELASGAKLLILDTAESLKDFTRSYAIERPWSYEDRHYVDYCIDWARLAFEYSGIIIAPYQWSQRLDLEWYYGWDCASGCIWDLTAIASVELLASRSEVSS